MLLRILSEGVKSEVVKEGPARAFAYGKEVTCASRNICSVVMCMIRMTWLFAYVHYIIVACDLLVETRKIRDI